MDTFKIALIQMKVVNSKELNISKAQNMTAAAAEKGAQVIVLPEMFSCPYSTGSFPLYAEKEKGETWQQLSLLAKTYNITLIGGSMPELDAQGKIYNTCYVFDNNGKEIAKHRKLHLFDIDIKDGQYFKESDTLSPGQGVTVCDTMYGKFGIMICYDIRFPELARLLVQKGAEFIIVPGAFNMTTGPAHWEILFRGRALDNQVYTVGVAPARDDGAEYISYANSIICGPWGNVHSRMGTDEGVLIKDIDRREINKIRNELPLLKHVRNDLYQLKEANS